MFRFFWKLLVWKPYYGYCQCHRIDIACPLTSRSVKFNRKYSNKHTHTQTRANKVWTKIYDYVLRGGTDVSFMYILRFYRNIKTVKLFSSLEFVFSPFSVYVCVNLLWLFKKLDDNGVMLTDRRDSRISFSCVGLSIEIKSNI